MQDELHKIQNILAHESRHDHLTGVLNRRAIEDILNIEVTRAHRQKLDLAIGICDIDSFKQVNDTYGHLVGDDVLCSITNRLQTCLRDYDYLARFGGEEFIILAPGLKAKDRLQFFERLRKAIEEEPLNTRNGKVKITISIGVHNLRQQDSIDSLLSTADNALYKAKKAGRNLVYCEE
jgi:diguanylate cyclase (GGDEF)-like protein